MSWLLKLAAGNPLILVWIAGGVFLAGVSIGGSGAWWLQGLRLDSAKAETEVCTVKLGALGNQIEQQNAAVDELTKKAAAARAKSAKAEKVAKGATAAHSALVRAWEARIAAPEGKTCVDALQAIRSGK